MNRVNGVLEQDVTIRFLLVANTSSVFYYDSGSDPYTNGNGVAMLGENQTTCDNIIGTSNYDMGHVFSTGGGGVASLGVAFVQLTIKREVLLVCQVQSVMLFQLIM